MKQKSKKKGKKVIKKDLIFKMVVFLVIIICLVVIVVVHNVTKKNSTDTKVEDSTEVVDGYVTYICSAKQEASDNFIPYLVEEIKTEDGRALEGHSYVKLQFDDKEKYNELKSSLDDITYDDKKLIINVSSDITSDYTKDVNGEELNLDFETYKTDLEAVGYECSVK
jgi:hypothetical protein